MVDTEGYVALHTNRYSIPADFIGRRVEVRESRQKIEIELDARRIVTHTRLLTTDQRITLREHRTPRGEGPKRNATHPDEQAILTAAPELAPYVEDLKRRGRKVIGLALRHLLRMLRGYPREPFLGAIAEAAQFGLYDLDRVERMILRRVQRDFFLLEGNNDD